MLNWHYQTLEGLLITRKPDPESHFTKLYTLKCHQSCSVSVPATTSRAEKLDILGLIRLGIAKNYPFLITCSYLFWIYVNFYENQNILAENLEKQ